MQRSPTYFSFVGRSFDPATRVLTCTYESGFSSGDPLIFTETVTFPHPFDLKRLPDGLFDRLLNALHLILGISYYKLYCPSELRVPYRLDEKAASFWGTVYRKGLGEFAYRNNLDLRYIHFPRASEKDLPEEVIAPAWVETTERALVGIGGGKDSCVAIELLREEKIPMHGFVIETYTHHDIAQHVCDIAGIEMMGIQRLLDAQVFAPLQGSYKGHIPISAVYAFLGYTAALLYDYSYVVTGNEWSSNFGNVLHCGEEVNHQWSKSVEFENLFTEYTGVFLSPSVRYFSIVRPLYEIRIAELFSKHPKYFDTFTSCNRKFRIDASGRPKGMWCGECPKCAFVFLMLAPFIEKERLVTMFGKDLLNDRALLSLFEDILGYGSMKPFDCVGTFDEARAALYLVREAYAGSAVMQRFIDKIEHVDSLLKSVRSVARTSSVPQRFRFAGMQRVLLAGYGREGKVTEAFLKAHYPHLDIAIGDDATNDLLSQQDSYDIVVKTAGMPKEKIAAHYTTATNMFFSRFKGTTIGVTGTKGKSTTASLIYCVLKEAGLPVELAGNIGRPMLELLDGNTKEKMAVLELSSYQLDDCDFSPHVAVATSLFEEHTDYHGTFDNYFAAKRHIVEHQKTGDVYVYNPAFEALAAWRLLTPATALPMRESLPFDRAVIPLLGDHNVDNVKLALTVADLFEVPASSAERAVREFKGLSHRLELVATKHGVRYYNDSISTTPQSAIAALNAVPAVSVIILGGQDRGYDFTYLEHEIRSRGIEHIVLFPDTGNRMFLNRIGLNIFETSDMRKAVEFAATHAKEGEAVLLSPASPSYNLYKNFEERGEAFRREVNK